MRARESKHKGESARKGERVRVGRGRKVEQAIGAITRVLYHRACRVRLGHAQQIVRAIKHLLSEVDSTAVLDNAGKRNPVAGCKRNPVAGARKARTRRFIFVEKRASRSGSSLFLTKKIH